MADSQRTIGRNDQPEPGGSESPPRPEKAELERQKLELEKQLLQRQLSAAGATMEWLKAAAVPVAVLGAAISFFIGFGQINQAEQNRSVDRFDKALTRLASDKVNERITGVSGLRLFLAESGSLLQGSALHFLVNAVAVESDEFVQSAMLDIFVDMKSLKLDQAKLNEALRTAIEHNRSLTKKIRTGRKERIAAIQKKIVAGSKQFEGLQANIPTPIPKRLVARLSQNEYLDFLDAQLGTFEKLDVKDDVPLHGLARLITMLLKLGAAGKDFSEIYCENCNFDAANLSGATFNDSYLRKANFSHTVLNGASFRNADLGGTIFFAADLSQADMRKTRFSSPDFSDTRESFPLLECAI